MNRTTISILFIPLAALVLAPAARAMPPLDGVDIPQWARDERAQLGVNTFPVPIRDAGRQGAVNRPGDVTLLVSGTKQFPAICIKFADYSNAYATASFDSMLFGDWTSGSAQDYYHEVSYGQFTLDGAAYGWYTSDSNKSWYGYGNGSARAARLAKEAAQKADSAVNFALYDNDHDGYVDCFTCIHAGYGAEETSSGSDIWSHSWSFTSAGIGAYTTNDPDPFNGGYIRIDGYVVDPERSNYTNHDSLVCIGVFCHEWGHALELPDLYDVAGSGEGVGKWSLMASGSWGGSSTSPWKPTHLGTWEKMELGWLSPRAVRMRDRYSLSRVEDNAKAFWLMARQRTFREYFLVENRNRTGFDSLMYQSGLLIYHIDDSIITARRGSNRVNSNNSGWRYGVALEQADGLDHLYNGNNRGDANDPWPGGLNRTTFDSTSTTPNSRTNYPSSSTLITSCLAENISAAGVTMTCTLAAGYQGQFTGGPDSGGYSWIDSDTAGGPTWSWPGSYGTRLGDGDDARWLVDLPFHVPFYGGSSDSVWVSTNGWLSFGANPGTNAPTNASVPSSAAPNNAVFAFWEDLNLVTSDSTGVFYQTGGSAPNRWCTVTWFNARIKGVNPGNLKPVNGVTFQATLHENGRVVLQYLDCAVGDTSRNWGRSATVGIENAAGTVGLQYLYNGSPAGNLLAGERAIEFYQQGADVGVTRILAPSGTIDSTQSVTPACSVYNYGSTTVGYDVRLTVGSAYDQTVSVAGHAPGTRRYVTFPAYAAWPRGTLAVACSTRLAGDVNNSNDRQTGSVFGRVLDAASDSIVRPQGAVALGTVLAPQARVRNDGNTAVTFDVRFTITDGYSSTKTVTSLAAGASTTVTFDNWTASAPGGFVTACSTRLAGDMAPADNRLVGAVTVRNDDVGVTRILAPSGTIDSTQSVTPACSVYNYGGAGVSYDVRLTVGSAYDQTVSVAGHAPGTRRYVTFPTYAAWPRGTLAVACSTRLAGDVNNSNDRQTGSVTVRVADVGVSHLLAPNGTVDSGTVVTPACSVYNHGTTTEIYAVRMNIGGGYVQADTVTSHAPGTRRYVTFPDWTAGPRGTHAVRCSTELPADMAAANDRALDSVFVRVLDAACARILAPVGTIDSTGAVNCRARVRNLGNTAVSVPLSFIVTGPTTDTIFGSSGSIAPGDSASVTVGQWTVGPRGNYQTSCTAGLAGDVDPANDRADSTFLVRVRDAAAVAILEPVGIVDTATTVTVRAVVANNGPTPENILAFVMVDGTSYRDSVFTSMAAGATDTFQFDDWTVNVPRGPRVLACSTWVTADPYPANDTCRQTVDVRVRDAGVSEIVAPTGSVDSGTVTVPQARVHNYGSHPETFQVRFAIGSAWSSTRDLSLGASLDTLLDFDPWTATDLGTFPTRCTTLLTADVRPANNLQTDSVTVVGNDIGVTAILAPVGSIEPGPVAPSCRVGNFGILPRDIRAWTFIRDQADSLVFSDSLDAAGVGPDTFADLAFTTWVATQGRFSVRCSAWTANDFNTTNDTLSASCHVPNHDVGVTAIRTPSGRVDTNVVVFPTATWRNCCTDEPVTFTARVCLVDPALAVVFTADSLVTGLGPGGEVTIRFPGWDVGADTGRWAVVCSTFADRDTNPANDTRSGSFVVTTMPDWPYGWHEVASMPPGTRMVKDGGWLAIDPGSRLIYATRGYKTGEFYEYNPVADAWTARAQMPAGLEGKLPRKGSRGVVAGDGYLYATKGNNSLGFWRYSVRGDSWFQLTDVPEGPRRKKVKGGTDLVYVERDGVGYVYLLKGYKTEFYRYNTRTQVWETLPDAPWGYKEKWDKGSWLVHDGASDGWLYAHEAKYYNRATFQHYMFRYSLARDSWDRTPLNGMPLLGLHGGRIRKKKAKDGSAGAYDNGEILALKGGNTQQFFRYNVAGDAWTEIDTMPAFGSTGRKRRVKYGGDLVSWGGGAFFALKGNKTNECWRYVTPLVFGRRPERSGATAGRTGRPAVGLTCAPNPLVSGCATVRYSLPHAGPGTVRVLDVTGREVMRRNLAPSRTGTLALDIRHLSAGIYLVRLESGDYTATRKLVVEK